MNGNHQLQPPPPGGVVVVWCGTNNLSGVLWPSLGSIAFQSIHLETVVDPNSLEPLVPRRSARWLADSRESWDLRTAVRHSGHVKKRQVKPLSLWGSMT